MPLRLFACDLDGTLLDHAGQISSRDVEALRRARAAGVMTVVATGRLLRGLEPYLDRLEITDEPIVAAQGALVCQRSGHVLRRQTLTAGLAKRATAIAHRHQAGMAYFWEDALIVDRFMRPPDQYEQWFGLPAQQVQDPMAYLQGQMIKFMAIHPDPDVIPALYEALQRELGQEVAIVRSWHWFVEGTSPGADKGSALAWLCGELGIDREDVLAMGDGDNDVTMLAWAGHSAAPADADPGAIAAAKVLAPPLSAQPVATVLEELLQS